MKARVFPEASARDHRVDARFGPCAAYGAGCAAGTKDCGTDP